MSARPASLVLSGPMFAGKTTTAELLATGLSFVVVSARQILRDRAPRLLRSRADLQAFGLELEERTAGLWLAHAAASVLESAPSRRVVIDSARTHRQLDAIRVTLTTIHHVHLTASLQELERRFERERGDLIDSGSLAEALAHPTEQETLTLGEDADFVLDTELLTPHAAVHKISEALDL